MKDTLQVEGYLVVKRGERWRWEVKARWTTRQPTHLGAGEVPIRVKLEVPLDLFEKPRYEVRGTVEMDAEQVLGELRARGLEVITIAPPAPDGSEE